MTRYLIIIILSILVNGCASMSEEEYFHQKWQKSCDGIVIENNASQKTDKYNCVYGGLSDSFKNMHVIISVNGVNLIDKIITTEESGAFNFKTRDRNVQILIRLPEKQNCVIWSFDLDNGCYMDIEYYDAINAIYLCQWKLPQIIDKVGE